MGSFFIILHTRVGGPAAASVAAHVLTPLIGLGLGLLAVHFLAVPLGVWWSYAIGLGIGLGWNALLWFVRDWRATRSVCPCQSGDPVSKQDSARVPPTAARTGRNLPPKSQPTT